MKGQTRSNQAAVKKQRQQQALAVPPISSKVIRRRSGAVVRQYPAEVGYHGSGEETKLNPEE